MDTDWTPEAVIDYDWVSANSEERLPTLNSLQHLPPGMRRIIQKEPLDCMALETWFAGVDYDVATHGQTLMHFFLTTKKVDGVRLMLEKGVGYHRLAYRKKRADLYGYTRIRNERYCLSLERYGARGTNG